MKKRYWGLLIFLVCSNGFLYWQVRRSNRVVADLETNLITAASSVQYALDFSMQQETFKLDLPDNPFHVVVILDERGCGICLRSEVRALNAHWNALKEYTRVYYYGPRKAYLTGHEIDFDYKMIANTDEIYGSDLGPVNPVSFLMVRGQLINLRVSSTSNPYHEELASAWYVGASSIAESLGGFASGYPSGELHGNGRRDK